MKELCRIEYYYYGQLAPTEDILKGYKNKEISWEQYELEFNSLITKRKIEAIISLDLLTDACLLCSEATAEHCHRRLLAEYFKKVYKRINIIHL